MRAPLDLGIAIRCGACDRWFDSERENVIPEHLTAAGERCRNSGMSDHGMRYVVRSDDEAKALAEFLTSDRTGHRHSISCGDGAACAYEEHLLTHALAEYFLVGPSANREPRAASHWGGVASLAAPRDAEEERVWNEACDLFSRGAGIPQLQWDLHLSLARAQFAVRWAILNRSRELQRLREQMAAGGPVIDDTLIELCVKAFNAVYGDGHDHEFDEAHPHAAFQAIAAALLHLGIAFRTDTQFSAAAACGGTADCVRCRLDAGMSGSDEVRPIEILEEPATSDDLPVWLACADRFADGSDVDSLCKAYSVTESQLAAMVCWAVRHRAETISTLNGRVCALLHCDRRREFELGNHDDACPLATGYVPTWLQTQPL